MPTAITSEALVMAGHYVLTLLGAVAAYVLSRKTVLEGAGAIAFLQKLFPDKTERFYTIWDFTLTSIFGSIIGVIVFSPQSNLQSLSAGFGWASAVRNLSANYQTTANQTTANPRTVTTARKRS